MLEVGDSFKLLNENGIHLHFIVAERSPGNNDVVMLVYLSSAEKYIDETTVLNIGDHPFISKRCYVRYRNLMILSRSKVEECIVEHFEKVSAELLAKIQDGIVQSRHVSKTDKETFTTWKTDRLMRDSNF